MSTFIQDTKHPETGEWQPATWHDNYYGPREYGVQFPDGSVFNPLEHELETRGMQIEDIEVDQYIGNAATKIFTLTIDMKAVEYHKKHGHTFEEFSESLKDDIIKQAKQVWDDYQVTK